MDTTLHEEDERAELDEETVATLHERLDTYMGVDTGVHILLLLIMLVYMPAWAVVKMLKS